MGLFIFLQTFLKILYLYVYNILDNIYIYIKKTIIRQNNLKCNNIKYLGGLPKSNRFNGYFLLYYIDWINAEWSNIKLTILILITYGDTHNGFKKIVSRPIGISSRYCVIFSIRSASTRFRLYTYILLHKK